MKGPARYSQRRATLPALMFVMVATLLALAAGRAAAAAYDPFFAAPVTVADFGAGARALGIAAGDFDGDSRPDLVEGRIVGGSAVVTLQKGNGDGSFQTPVQFAWRVQSFNAWTFAPGDVNGDGKLDLVWGSTAAAASRAARSGRSRAGRRALRSAVRRSRSTRVTCACCTATGTARFRTTRTS